MRSCRDKARCGSDLPASDNPRRGVTECCGLVLLNLTRRPTELSCVCENSKIKWGKRALSCVSNENTVSGEPLFGTKTAVKGAFHPTCFLPDKE